MSASRPEHDLHQRYLVLVGTALTAALALALTAAATLAATASLTNVSTAKLSTPNGLGFHNSHSARIHCDENVVLSTKLRNAHFSVWPALRHASLG